MTTTRMIEIVLGVAVITSAACFLLGIAATMAAVVAGSHVEGDQSLRASVIGLGYGFPFGLFLGVVVLLRKRHNRKRH